MSAKLLLQSCGMIELAEGSGAKTGQKSMFVRFLGNDVIFRLKSPTQLDWGPFSSLSGISQVQLVQPAGWYTKASVLAIFLVTLGCQKITINAICALLMICGLKWWNNCTSSVKLYFALLFSIFFDQAGHCSQCDKSVGWQNEKLTGFFGNGKSPLQENLGVTLLHFTLLWHAQQLACPTAGMPPKVATRLACWNAKHAQLRSQSPHLSFVAVTGRNHFLGIFLDSETN